MFNITNPPKAAKIRQINDIRQLINISTYSITQRGIQKYNSKIKNVLHFCKNK